MNKKPSRPQVNPNTLKRLLGYLSVYKTRVIVVVICILLSAIANVMSSLFIQRLIDDYISPLLLEANPVFDALFRAIVQMACIYVIGILASLIYNRTMAVISQGILKKIRDDMFAHMQTLPIKYFDTHTHGDVMSHYTNDTDALRQMLSQSLPQLLSSCVTIVAVFVSMLYLSVWMTLFIVVFLFLILKVVKSIAGKSSVYFIKQQQNIGDVNGYIEEMINGQKVVKVFCHEEEAKAVFDKKNQELCDSMTTANTYANILMPINAQLGNISYVFCAMAGGVLALQGFAGFTLGKLVSFLTFNKSFSQPINQISQQINAIVMALAGADRIFKLLDQEPEVDEGYVQLVNVTEQDGQIKESEKQTGLWAWKHYHQDDGTTTYRKLEGDVVFDDVDFGYNDEKIILHNIKIYAKPGQKIAFVGATGAGKTTITNLINRFYDIQDGKIRFDGININKIHKKDLRRSLGIVLQDTHLFTGTVMDNIRYGKLDATDDEVIAAAKLANAHSFIKRLPDGYRTMITGDGANLSQGQRQLLAIARAAVANPPALILDEATSSIDTRTEKLVQEGMDRLMKGRTTFVIAHRLSTVRNSDCIMVLEQGRIIERGTHDELLERKGKYYQLYTGKAV